GVDQAYALAQHVEDVFRAVAAFHQFVQLQESRAALDGVEATEDRIEQIRIIRTAFQFHQLFGQLFENLAGFYQEILKDLIIGIDAHYVPLKTLDWKADRQRRPDC